MNIYDRIINILLEARIEDYLERLDEANLLDKGLTWIQKIDARNKRAAEEGINRSSRVYGHKSMRGVRLQGRKGYGNPTNRPGKEDFVSDTVSGRIASMQKDKRSKRADEARYESGKKIKAGMPKKGGLTPPVKAYIRDMRAGAGDNPNVGAKKPGETGIDLMNRRQKAHIDSRGKKKPKP